MKNLLIVGAGNFGKIVYDYALLCQDYQEIWSVKGFLDNDINALENDPNYPSVLSSVESYQIQSEDVFVCAFAGVQDRKLYTDLIKNKNGRFVSVIHPTANINRNANLGEGIFLGAFTTVSVNCNIADHVIIQDHCNIGHDSIVGACSHLYVGCRIGGKNTIGEEAALFTGSILYPKLKIGDRAIVGAGSVVMRNVKPETSVLGNPAKRIEPT